MKVQYNINEHKTLNVALRASIKKSIRRTKCLCACACEIFVYLFIDLN